MVDSIGHIRYVEGSSIELRWPAKSCDKGAARAAAARRLYKLYRYYSTHKVCYRI